MEVFLIRHTAVDVPARTCYGQTDVPLRDTFQQEAEVTRSNLKGMVFDHVYTSPLSRASRLAAYCGFPDAERDNRLMEMNMGTWEMQSFDDLDAITLERLYADYLHLSPEGGESFEQVYARVDNFLTELTGKPYRRVAIFAHGGVLIAARVRAGQITQAEGFNALTPYGGIERIVL